MVRKTGKKAIPLFVVMLLLLMSGAAFAATFFGVKQYAKERGAPVTFEENFYIPSEASNVYIQVKNGEAGDQEVKNLSILLNGAEVVSSKDLKSNPFVKFVQVKPAYNTLTINLKGQEGNKIFVEVGGEIVKKK